MGHFGVGSKLCDFSTSGGELVALDGATGKQVWKQVFNSMNYGGGRQS